MVAQYKQQLSTLNKIEARLASFAEEVRLFNEEVGELLKSVGLSDKKADFEVAMPSQYAPIIVSRRAKLDELIASQLENSDNSLASIKARIELLTQRFQITDAKRLQYGSFQKQKQELEDSAAALQNDVNYIETVLEPALQRDRAKRLEFYLDYFDLLLEEKTALDKLYEPLHAALSHGTETDRKLEFESKITFDSAGYASQAFDLIDTRRKTRYKSKEALSLAVRL